MPTYINTDMVSVFFYVAQPDLDLVRYVSYKSLEAFVKKLHHLKVSQRCRQNRTLVASKIIIMHAFDY